MDGRDLHVGDLDCGVLPPAAPLAIATQTLVGIAYGCEAARRGPRLASFIGEGGASLGEWHEAVNFAAVQKLPHGVRVENNQLGAGHARQRADRGTRRFALRAAGYGMPGHHGVRQRPRRGRGGVRLGRGARARGRGAGAGRARHLPAHRATPTTTTTASTAIPRRASPATSSSDEARALGGGRPDRAVRGAPAGDRRRSPPTSSPRFAPRSTSGSRTQPAKPRSGALAGSRPNTARASNAPRRSPAAAAAAERAHASAWRTTRRCARRLIEAMESDPRSSCSARTSVAATAAPSASPAVSPSSSAASAASTRRSPRARSSAARWARRSPGCGRWSRCSSPTSSPAGFNALVNNAAKLHWRWGRTGADGGASALRRRHRHR